jgi:hypothetical protein
MVALLVVAWLLAVGAFAALAHGWPLLAVLSGVVGVYVCREIPDR